MQKSILTLFALCFATGVFAQKAEKFANTILAEDLKKHLSVIAHDSLEGRDTGSEGQRKAANYITNHFKNLGLKAIGDNGTYLQAVPLVKRGLAEAYLKIGDAKKENLKDFFLNGSGSIPQETSIEVVNIGYGIESDLYNNYKNLDVTGKAVLILTGEPKGADGNYLVTGTDKSSIWSLASADLKKREVARAKGAKFVIMVSDKSDEENEKTYSRMRSFAPRMNRMSFKDAKNPASAMIGITLNQKTGKEYLGLDDAGLKEFLAGTKNISPKPLTIKVETKEEAVNTSNVMGFLEGTDKKDEVLVISAHYDHIGISADGQINNGANDDGSGTVSVMELAEAFAKAKAAGNGPRRSILFMTVTGEEKGLLGSEYYVNHPIIPIENTVVDLNVDMVGRTDPDHEGGKPDYIYVIGSDKLSSELHAIGEEMNKKYVNLDLDYKYNDPKDPNRFYYRSDHYNFAQKKIPIAFYFNGVHADYHKPTDDIEKIEFEKAAKVVKLVFYTAWEIANRDNRILVDSNKP
jgi:hypothetical protein